MSNNIDKTDHSFKNDAFFRTFFVELLSHIFINLVIFARDLDVFYRTVTLIFNFKI